MKKSYCPFDESDCSSMCALYIGEGDHETSPCALAHIGARNRECFNLLVDDINHESFQRIAHALEAIAEHFDPDFTRLFQEETNHA